ncbi:MAG: hypothetical protein D8M22_03220 [Armatimonadetes bacterium]|nr:hypothetical protein [Armatimonadota bacterium]
MRNADASSVLRTRQNAKGTMRVRKVVRTSILALICLLSAWSGAQTPPTAPPQPIRLQVRHADPWVIKLMLEGGSVVSPEMSTLFGFLGAPPNTGNAVNRLFQNGTLIVNPTDNSIWFFPDRP